MFDLLFFLVGNGCFCVSLGNKVSYRYGIDVCCISTGFLFTGNAKSLLHLWREINPLLQTLNSAVAVISDRNLGSSILITVSVTQYQVSVGAWLLY